jgi:mRNA interferase MazF
MMASQFEIYQATLEPHEGSEQGGTRPVLVISRTSINRSLPILAVLPVTSLKARRRIYSTEVMIPAGTARLTHDSLALAHQVRTISSAQLQRRYGFLDDQDLQEKIRQAIRVFLDLD